jgi:hypothetical protein
MVYVLNALGIIKLPAGAAIPSRKFNFRELIKAVVIIGLSFPWSILTVRMVYAGLLPNSPVGGAVILVPDLAFLIVGMVYLTRAF